MMMNDINLMDELKKELKNLYFLVDRVQTLLMSIRTDIDLLGEELEDTKSRLSRLIKSVEKREGEARSLGCVLKILEEEKT